MEKIIGIEKPAGKVRKYIFWKISSNGIFFYEFWDFTRFFVWNASYAPVLFPESWSENRKLFVDHLFWKIIVKWQQLWDFNNFSAKLLRIVDTIFRLRTWYPAYTKNSGSLFTDYNLRLNTRMITHCPKLNMIEEK